MRQKNRTHDNISLQVLNPWLTVGEDGNFEKNGKCAQIVQKSHFCQRTFEKAF